MAMVLDLGGIAKGYTADHMLKVLKSNKLNRVLIDAGGDLLIGDAPVGKKGWKIEIGGRTHPDLPILTLSNIAVATSGDVEQFVTIARENILTPYRSIYWRRPNAAECKLTSTRSLRDGSRCTEHLRSLVMGKEPSIKFLKNKNLFNAFLVEVNDDKESIATECYFPDLEIIELVRFKHYRHD